MSIQLFDRKLLISCLGVLGVSSSIAFPAFAQSNPFNTGNSSLSNTRQSIPVTPGTSNPNGTPTYPYGSRIGGSGIISTPGGQVTLPSVRINNGDGSTTYYYPNGSRATIDGRKIPPTGAIVR